MTSQRTAFVIAAAGILVAMSTLVMYDAGLLCVQHPYFIDSMEPFVDEFKAEIRTNS